MPSQMQTIVLTLEDGSKHPFTGPAAIFEGGPQVVFPITAYQPQDMPPGCTFASAADLEPINA